MSYSLWPAPSSKKRQNKRLHFAPADQLRFTPCVTNAYQNEPFRPPPRFERFANLAV